jgi:hypothetical protein
MVKELQIDSVDNFTLSRHTDLTRTGIAQNTGSLKFQGELHQGKTKSANRFNPASARFFSPGIAQ